MERKKNKEGNCIKLEWQMLAQVSVVDSFRRKFGQVYVSNK